MREFRRQQRENRRNLIQNINQGGNDNQRRRHVHPVFSEENRTVVEGGIVRQTGEAFAQPAPIFNSELG